MQQRRLGRTGLQVSRLGLGTGLWGRDTDVHEARDVLRAFVEAGGTLVDTGAGYADGRSEQVLGSLLGDVARRDDLVIATAAGVDPNGSDDTSRRALLRTLDTSLRCLGTDHVDLWQVQGWSEQVPWEESLAALDIAVQSGQARYVGVSDLTGWQVAAGQAWQLAWPQRTRLASAQVEYSLLDRTAEQDLLPAANALEIGVLAWATLGRGVLTGKYRTGIPADSRAASDHLGPTVTRYLDERCRRIVEAVVRAADGLALSPVQVSLAWARDRPGVSAAVVGPRTAGQARRMVTAEDVELPTEITAALDDVSRSAPVEG